MSMHITRQLASPDRTPPLAHSPTRPLPQGFTLLELVLVLTIIIMVGAAAWPMLNEPLARQRIQSAADILRSEWVNARVDAMTHGQIRMFRYEPESGHYELRWWETFDDAVEAALPIEVQARPSSNAPPQRELPEGVLFVAGRQAADARAAYVASSDSLQSGMMAPPILFYPDGSTSTARLTLGDEAGRRRTVSLRGLTGVVTVTEGEIDFSMPEP